MNERLTSAHQPLRLRRGPPSSGRRNSRSTATDTAMENKSQKCGDSCEKSDMATPFAYDPNSFGAVPILLRRKAPGKHWRR